MKIDALRFKNINSLKGEWTVDFNLPPLSDAGVFAITGPNGSGKTSILDAITLGLYGETFKFDHPSVHVMTKQTDDSFAEVMFTRDGKQFRSRWSVQKQDGQLTPPEMQIVSLNGVEQIMASQSSQVREYIAKLTGMDFRRFTRSMVLAQGDFAAFLNSLDNERLDILEQIVGPNVYEDYQHDILATAELEQEKLAQLQQALSTIPLKTPIEVEALEHDLIDFKTQIEECKDQRIVLEQQNASVQAVDDIVEQIAEVKHAVEQNNNEVQQIKTEIASVESVKDFSNIESGVEESARQHQQLKSSQEALSAYQNELTQLQSTIGQLTIEDRQQPDLSSQSVTEKIENLGALKYQLGQLKFDLSTETELQATLEEQLLARQASNNKVTAWLKAKQGDQGLLDSFPDIEGLKKIRIELASAKQEKSAYTKKVKTEVVATKQKDSEVSKLKKELEKLQESLQKNDEKSVSLLDGQSLEQIQDDLAEVEHRLINYKGLVALAEDCSKLPKATVSRGFFGIKSKAKQEPSAVIENSVKIQKEGPALEYEKLLEEQEDAKNILVTLEKAIVWEARLRKQGGERMLLVDDEACPLCGSTDHPFADNPPAVIDSRKALADQQKLVKSMQTQADKLKVQIKKTHVVKKDVSVNNKKRIEFESYWLELCTRLNMVSDNFTINDIKEAKSLLAEQNKIIAGYTTTIKSFESLQNKIEQQKLLQTQKTAALEAALQAQEQLQLADDIDPQYEKTLELTLVDKTEVAQELTAQVTEQLEVLNEKTPGKGKEDKLFERLQQRQTAFRSYAEKQESLQQEIASLALKIEACRNKCQKLEQQLEQCTTSLHASEVASLHLALVEKQKLIVVKEQSIQHQQATVKASDQQFQASLTQVGISDLQAAQTLVERKQQIPEMQQQIVDLDEQSKQLQIAIEQKQVELKTAQEQALTTLTIDEIIAKQKAVGSQLSIANQEIRTIESVLDQQSSLQSKFTLLQEKIQQQLELTETSIADAKKLESESPAVIKRRVQQMMVDQLMSKSNQFLENISGRYSIHQKKSEQGLALVIEDKAEASVFRSPQTLSGGESFVVSLSLALGLSGMATKGQEVESLFLDEGFGTLDEETLYVVLSTLQSLRHSGKMVGVISHVKELKDRIRTQIRLSKEMSGHSRLEVVS